MTRQQRHSPRTSRSGNRSPLGPPAPTHQPRHITLASSLTLISVGCYSPHVPGSGVDRETADGADTEAEVPHVAQRPHRDTQQRRRGDHGGQLLRAGKVVCLSFKGGESLASVQNLTYVSGLTPAVMDAAAASATTHLCPELAGRVSPDERLKADAEHRRADAAIDKEEAAAAKLTAARAKRDAQEQEDR